jgi:hypothetical protein
MTTEDEASGDDAASGDAEEQEARNTLERDWKLPAVCQFCRTFQAALALARSFSADVLEGALLRPDDHRVFLSELLYRLLARAGAPFGEAEQDVWEQLLRKKMLAQWHDAFDENPLEGRDFYTVSPAVRVGCRPLLLKWAACMRAASKRALPFAAPHHLRPVRVAIYGLPSAARSHEINGGWHLAARLAASSPRSLSLVG